MNMFDFPKDKDGLIYVRQSSVVQQQNNIHSYEMQTDKFLEHFRNMGCTGNITIIADDEAMSGTLDIHARPGMTKMVKLIESDKVGWIGAVHVNRLTRDPWLITPTVLMKKCYEHKVWVATLRMNFNFEDEYCQRVFMLEAEESARHLKWMKLVLGGGKQTASDHGYYDGRWIVPGYIVDRTDPKRKRYIIYRPHAEIVFWLFKRFLELDGNFAQLRREVEARPYLFPPFESWVDKETISRFRLKPIPDGLYKGYYKPKAKGLAYILCNPVYIGWWIPQNGGCIENHHEAIVPEGLFTFAHKRLSVYDLMGNRQKPERVVRNGSVEALLKKVLRNEHDIPFYAQPDSGGVYKCMRDTGLVRDYQLSVHVDILDPPFVEKFLEHLRSWEGCEDWEDRVQHIEENKHQRKQTILELIGQAQKQWQEVMTLLKDPNIPKTDQMKIDLATTCAGLEGKIAQLHEDLQLPEDEEQEDEVIQYQIYTLLPDLIDNWPDLSFASRLKFVGAVTRKVVLSHPAPVWLKMEIHWKLPEWGIDIAHIRRRAYKASWTEKEDAIIQQMYETEDAAAILEKLPDRTWEAIRQRGQKLGVFRRGYKQNTTEAYKEYDDVALRDVAYAQENGLTLNGKNLQWTPLCGSQ